MLNWKYTYTTLNRQYLIQLRVAMAMLCSFLSAKYTLSNSLLNDSKDFIQ